MIDMLEFRKVNINDSLEEIAELLYRTDPYIYPYWFKSLDNCKKELTKLMLEDKFFFNIDNLYIMKDNLNNKIIGVVCVVDRDVDLNYDYTKLERKNRRYKFTIDNYIKELIKEVQNSQFAYISNVCVHPEYRGMHVGSMMLKQIIEIYKRQYFDEIALDVLADNIGAIKLYQNLGFQQSSDIFDGFNNPNLEKPKVFSMRNDLKNNMDN